MAVNKRRNEQVEEVVEGKRGRGRPKLPNPHEDWDYVFADNSRG